MPELLLSCQELSKAFGAAPLFEGLSLGVFEGDHIGLVGPNGSGKSTLLKILAGLEEPSSGTRAARKRLRIGYVPQDPGLRGRDDRGRRSCARPSATCDLDEHEAEGRVAVAMGKAGFADAAAGHGHALRRLEEAPRHRARAGGRARAPAPRRAHEPPRRGRHPLARGAAAARARGLRGREPRPLLPGGGGGARDRAQPRLRPRASSTCAAATAGSWRRRTSSWPGRRPTRSRSATACGASSTGSRARPAPAPARRRRASTRRSGCRTSSPTSTRARSPRQSGIDFSATERKTKRLLVAEGVTKSFGDRDDRPRPRPRPLAGHAPGAPRRERQRQDARSSAS